MLSAPEARPTLGRRGAPGVNLVAMPSSYAMRVARAARDYRLPRRPNVGLIALAVVTAAVAVPFVGFVVVVGLL